MKKIAILYICTGKYNLFFKDFHFSSEKFFLPNKLQKEYFVFTDDLNLTNESNVHLIKKECKGFPADSLFRFDMFLQLEQKLKEYDYIFFFNSNMLFVEPINSSFLPTSNDSLVFTLNSGYYKKKTFRYPYERDIRSTAYIPYKNKEYKYVIGGLNGGTSEAYISFMKECQLNIKKDDERGLMAIYHDESHINKYYFNYGGKVLHPSYAYPEGAKLPYSPKIIIRDKVKVDKYFDKVKNHSKTARIRKALKYIYRAVQWPLQRILVK